MLSLIAIYKLLIVLSVTTFLTFGKKSYDGYTLYEITPDTKDKADYLRLAATGNTAEMLYKTKIDEAESGISEIQIWRYGNVDTSFEMLISPLAKKEFLQKLNSKQISYEVKVENIQSAIDNENKPVSRNHFAAAKFANADYFSKYRNLGEVNSFIHKLAKQHPNIVKIESIGSSIEGRPIYLVKVGSDKSGKKPSIWIDAGIHAREWITVSTVTYILNKLVTEYRNPAIKNLVDSCTWYIVPVLNVDGYNFTHSPNGDRFWRRNRRPAPCAKLCCPGVDLNRNFDFEFGGPGTSKNTCVEIHPGKSAFSEPETRAMRDFILKHKDNLKAVVSLHSFSQMWLHPYNTRYNYYPEDIEDLISLAEKGVKAIQSVHGEKFQVGTAARLLNSLASGSSMDWVKGKANIKFSYGLELRPSRKPGLAGFAVNTSNIIPSGEEIWAGMKVVAEEVMLKFGKK